MAFLLWINMEFYEMKGQSLLFPVASMKKSGQVIINVRVVNWICSHQT